MPVRRVVRWTQLHDPRADLRRATGPQAARRAQADGVDVTTEGVESQALRGDDGQLYTLTGDLEGFHAGDHVRVVGKVAERTFCGQGTTLEVLNIKRA